LIAHFFNKFEQKVLQNGQNNFWKPGEVLYEKKASTTADSKQRVVGWLVS